MEENTDLQDSVGQLEAKLDTLYAEQNKLENDLGYWYHEDSLRDAYPRVKEVLNSWCKPSEMIVITTELLHSINLEISAKEKNLAAMVALLNGEQKC